ncbi:WD40 repeat domain-containing protein, partial [Streptomyces sp. NPDC055366]
TGHRDAITSVAFSPDGATLATGSEDNTARLWDLNTGKRRKTLTGHGKPLDGLTGIVENGVSAATFSPDGSIVATGCGDGTVRLFNVTTGKRIKTLSNHPYGVESIIFTPDENALIASGGDGTIRIWDVAAGEIRDIFFNDSSFAVSIALSSDGSTLARNIDSATVQLLNIAIPSPEEAIKKICQAIHRDFTQEERSKYLPEIPREPVCPP